MLPVYLVNPSPGRGKKAKMATKKRKAKSNPIKRRRKRRSGSAAAPARRVSNRRRRVSRYRRNPATRAARQRESLGDVLIGVGAAAAGGALVAWGASSIAKSTAKKRLEKPDAEKMFFEEPYRIGLVTGAVGVAVAVAAHHFKGPKALQQLGLGAVGAATATLVAEKMARDEAEAAAAPQSGWVRSDLARGLGRVYNPALPAPGSADIFETAGFVNARIGR